MVSTNHITNQKESIGTSIEAPHVTQEGVPVEKQPSTWSVQAVVSNLPTHFIPTHPPTTPIPFFHLLERLKTTPREGWRRFSIRNGESISDHMYRMSIITMLAPTSLSSRLDIPKCTKMALVHDMAESLVGDITPMDGIGKEEKNKRETETMDYISRSLLGAVGKGGREAGESLRAVWQEYEDNETLEAKFVHDVDKLELVLQMVEYEKAQEGMLDLGEFAWVGGRIILEEVREWCAEIMKEREEYWRGLGKTITGLDVGRKIIERLKADRETPAA